MSPSPSSYLKTILYQIITQKGSLAALVGLYALIFLIGTLVYKDYGVSWDEFEQIGIGAANYQMIVQNEPPKVNYTTLYYGPFFELILFVLSGQPPDSSLLYLRRHFLTFMAAFSGLLAFGVLILYITRKRWLAFWGVLFLFLSPRIFADSFYNSKDIPFMAVFIVGCLTQIWFLDSPSLLKALVHGIICAAAIATRISALILPVLTLIFLEFGLLLKRQDRRIKLQRYVLPGLLLILVVVGGIVLFYPILWSKTWQNFRIILQLMGHYPWDGGNLYLGQFISATQVPWHYIPVWVAITTPPLYLMLLLIGSGVVVARLVKIRHFRDLAQRRNDLLLLSWSFLPWLVVVLMGSVLYDGWRHLYFIYPGLLLLALEGLNSLSNLKIPYPRFKKVLLGFLIIGGLVGPISFMIRNHPFENLYFNFFAGKSMVEIKQNFDMDYWGLSYRKGLEAILAQDPRDHILYASDRPPGQLNLPILPPEQRKRLEYTTDQQKANYYLVGYLDHPGEYPFPGEVYSVVVDGAKILTVYRLR